MRAALAAAATLALLLAAPRAPAQSVDECMQARPVDAVTICRALIDDGRGSATVWAQLALSLSKRGRNADAERALADGIERYPRDADLLALRDRLLANQSEAERLERAAERNTSAVALGELKLTCRTRGGAVGIEACRRYLERTDVDGERIRARLAELGGVSTPVDAPAPIPEPRPVPEPEPRVATGPDDSPGPADVVTPLPRTGDGGAGDASPDIVVSELPEPVPDPAAERRRERVAAVQRALNALGLPAGAPDGIPGTRTRDALARFATLTGRAPDERFDETTLAALDAERDALERARAMLAESRAAERAARPDEALASLERAGRESAFLAVPAGYRRTLEEAVRAREEAEALVRPEPEPEPEPTPGDGPSDPAPLPRVPDGLSDTLLTRIGALERELADEEARARREGERLRDVVQRILSAQDR